MIGERLDPYEILALINSGGMNEVWKARDTRLGRIVEIKKAKEQHGERFEQEARTIGEKSMGEVSIYQKGLHFTYQPKDLSWWGVDS